LLSVPYDSWNTKNQVNIVLSNPPFGGQEEDGTEKNFPEEFRTKETADLFLALIIKILKKNGRAAVVLPDGSLYGNGIKTKIKQELLKKCNLHTIIRLPNGVFNPYTSIKTNLLFFEKGKSTKDVWYYDMPLPNDVKNFNKNRTITIEDFDLVRKWWFDRNENEYAWNVSIDSVIASNYNLDSKNPTQNEVEKTESVEVLIEKIEDSITRSKGLIDEIKK